MCWYSTEMTCGGEVAEMGSTSDLGDYLDVNQVEWNGLEHVEFPDLNIKTEVVHPVNIQSSQKSVEWVARDIESVVLFPDFFSLLQDPSHMPVRPILDVHGLILGR